MNSYQKPYRVSILSKSQKVGDAVSTHVLYVASGKCLLLFQNQEVPLEAGEVLILNLRQEVFAKLLPGSLMADIAVDYFQLCQLGGVGRALFSMTALDPDGKYYVELKQRVEGFLLAYSGMEAAQECGELGEFFRLVQLMFLHFSQPEADGDQDKHTKLVMLLQENNDISLKDLAAQMYLSPAAVSRMFQKITGENFTQYKRRIRLEQVKWELAHSGKSVSAIALEAGYTSFTTFNRDFKDVMGMTPSQYRKEKQHQEEELPDRQALRQIETLLKRKNTQEDPHTAVHQVEISLNNMTPWRPYRNRLLNVGAANLLLRAEMQNQISFLARHLEVEYIRVWSLFSQEMLQGDGEDGVFHFTNQDAVLDFAVDHNLKLFIDLAQRRDFSLASEQREIYSRETRSVVNWFELFEKFLIHIRRRYSKEIVNQWVFEFSFYLNENADFYQKGASKEEIWQRGYGLVKSYFPQAKVAGPGLLAGNAEDSFQIIDRFLRNESHPDIFTFSIFPYVYGGSLVDEPLFQKGQRKMNDFYFLLGIAKSIRLHGESRGFTGEFWITEWGVALGNRNYIQDSCYRGSTILDNMMRLQGVVEAVGIFCASDLLAAYGDSGSVLCGASGILTQTGIRKPAYYAYRFLRELGGNKLAETDHCAAACGDPSELCILCYNHKALGPKYFLLPEDAHSPNSLESLFLDLDPLNMEIHILDLPSNHGPYFVRHQILNEKKGGPLGKWFQLECSPALTRNDLDFLRNTCVPDVVLNKREAVGGSSPCRLPWSPMNCGSSRSHNFVERRALRECFQQRAFFCGRYAKITHKNCAALSTEKFLCKKCLENRNKPPDNFGDEGVKLHYAKKTFGYFRLQHFSFQGFLPKQ